MLFVCVGGGLYFSLVYCVFGLLFYIFFLFVFFSSFSGRFFSRVFFFFSIFLPPFCSSFRNGCVSIEQEVLNFLVFGFIVGSSVFLVFLFVLLVSWDEGWLWFFFSVLCRLGLFFLEFSRDEYFILFYEYNVDFCCFLTFYSIKIVLQVSPYF